MRYAIRGNYHVETLGYVDLGGKTWDDVEDWYVKWDRLNVKFKGASTWSEFELNSDSLEIDWKRPTSTTVYGLTDDDCCDYSKEIAEQE